MKSMIIVLASLTLNLTAFAHIEPGTWVGTTPDGQPCSMVAGEEFFLNDMPHPLNERVPIQVNEDTFLVQHPPVIDASTGTASFNHDFFHGVLAVKGGAKALVITMVHGDDFHGPGSFQVIDHQWKTNVRKNLICNNIRHQD